MDRRGISMLVALALAGPLLAQSKTPPDHGSITIVTGAEATLPVPTLSLAKANVDVASLLFARLARLGKRINTTAERDFEPELARGWTRRDSLTIVLELDPRAKWHDGVPVTSHDVVWSLSRARDSTVSPTYALLLRRIASVTADGPARVVVTFREAYPEQLYDAAWQVPPLPAHLLESVPPESLATSAFVRHPIGSGPYRWGAFVPNERLELVANPGYFRGQPKLDRVVFLLVRSAEAQLNAVLSGTADAFEGFLLIQDIGRIVAEPKVRITTYPSFTVGYLLMNQKAYANRSTPHPILSDPEVRRALTMAIDRKTLFRAIFGPYVAETNGPMGQASWIRKVAPPGPGYDPNRVRALLQSRGWRDSDGDGILDKNGAPLALRLNYPGTSVPRVALAEPLQQMFRQVGVKIDLVRLEFPIWVERRNKGEFDLDFTQVTVDPTPSGLIQSWSCAGMNGGGNVASACNPGFDSAYALAIRDVKKPEAAWNRAVGRLTSPTPAIFLYSPVQIVVASTRYRNVSFRPEAPWADLWTWSVDPSQRLARDDR